MNLPMINKLPITLGVVLLVGLLYAFTLRGAVGNPTPAAIDKVLSVSGKPFETSQERSRYALILSLYNYRTFDIDHYASMGTPDIGRINNHYFSFFPPGASVIALPAYIMGLYFNIPQIAVFSVSTFFAILTMIVIYLFSRKLNLHWSIALFSALAFAFATNAWGYSVTFYAHLISAFLITTSLYLIAPSDKSKIYLKHSIFWVLYSIAVFVDFPNLIIFLPIAITALSTAFEKVEDSKSLKIRVKPLILLLPVIFVVLMLCYAQYNKIHFGNYTTLSNAIPRVKDLKDVNLSVPETGKDATGALQTRNMLEGYVSFLISRDRGVLVYSPIVLLSIFGIGFLELKKKRVEILLVAVPVICLTLYTMFGDPYGGWAFGSRYMIAIFPALCILVGIGLQRYSQKIWAKLLFSVVFIYSTAVSLLAPLTTNVIPPFVEARNIGLSSDYSINIRMLSENKLNSFLYNQFFGDYITGVGYYLIILVIVASFGLVTIWYRRAHYE